MHISESEVCQRDVATLRKYREDYYKITLHQRLRLAGYEEADGVKKAAGRKNTAGNEETLEASISRTRAAIFELALCNDWEWFVTLTLNPEYHDRKDLKSYKVKLSAWIKNYNRIHKTNIRYLLIPETHQDRSWHVHGMLMGLPVEHLHAFTEQERLPIRILIELAKENQIYSWPAYAKKIGYITISRIRHLESASKYITKYITKDLAKSRIGLNEHIYYCSKGLKRAEKIYQGPLTKDLDEDYKNDYVKIKTVKSFDEAIRYFTDDEN